MYKKQKKILLNSYTKSNAWIFAGYRSLGKLDVARNFAHWLLSSKNPADLLIIDEDKVKIEHVDKVRQFISLTASCAKYKVAIINNFENTTASAANSLLRILEDTQQNYFIILIAEDLYKILATIRSRCFILRFPVNSSSEVYDTKLIDEYKVIINCLTSRNIFKKKIEKEKLHNLLYFSFSRILKYKYGIQQEELFQCEFLEISKLKNDILFYFCKFKQILKLIEKSEHCHLDHNYISSISIFI